MPVDGVVASRLAAPMVPLLFFACPKSLVSLILEADVVSSYREHGLRVVQGGTAEQKGEEGDGDRMPSLTGLREIWCQGRNV